MSRSPFDVSLGPLAVVCSYLRPIKDRQLLQVSKVFGKSFLLSSREQMLIYDENYFNGDFLYWYLDEGGDVDNPSKLFYRACGNGKSDVVRQLLAHSSVDPSACKNYAIRWASVNCHTEVVRLLLADPRVDPSDRNNWDIMGASVNGHTEVVRLLLAHPNVDPSDRDNFVIKWASYFGHTEVVRLLLTHPKVDPTADNNFAIRYASENGHSEVVRLLLEHPKVDPSDWDRHGYLLYVILKIDTPEIVKLLEISIKKKNESFAI
jgi:ankyrin repeat protein